MKITSHMTLAAAVGMACFFGASFANAKPRPPKPPPPPVSSPVPTITPAGAKCSCIVKPGFQESIEMAQSDDCSSLNAKGNTASGIKDGKFIRYVCCVPLDSNGKATQRPTKDSNGNPCD